MKIHIVAAARPNFMKVAPLYHEAVSRGIKPVLVHTGQHYDKQMSDVFFESLGLPRPDICLGCKGGKHGEHTACVLSAYEDVCLQQKPDIVVVVGDVNSTLACTLAATKLGIRVAHLEAGLRSHDWSMPEEINRVLTDAAADLLWAPSEDGVENLKRENVHGKVELVGNIMIDSLEAKKEEIKRLEAFRIFNLEKFSYILATFHRPSNVDSPKQLQQLAEGLQALSRSFKILLPLHPRTESRLLEAGLLEKLSSCVKIVKPLDYLTFMSLVFYAQALLTDSGGIQEETSYLGIQCYTARKNTERPITLSLGTNKLVGLEEIGGLAEEIKQRPLRQETEIPYWDGKTAQRTLDSLERFL